MAWGSLRARVKKKGEGIRIYSTLRFFISFVVLCIQTAVAIVTHDTTILWDSNQGDWEDLPFLLPQFTVYLPREISRVERVVLSGLSSLDSLEYNRSRECHGSSFITIYDRFGDIFATLIDDFFSTSTISRIESEAVAAGAAHRWKWADINHPMGARKDADPRLGNSFPGKRLIPNDAAALTRLMQICLTPVFAVIDPQFPIAAEAHSRMAQKECLYGLVTPFPASQNLGVKWLDSHRLPHNDIRWNLGIRTNGHLPESYASVLALTRSFNGTGTGFYREKSTGLSLLKTRLDNELAQGSMNPHHSGRRLAHLDLLAEVPDEPHGPFAPPHSIANAWTEAIGVAHLRFNRLVLYDGRRLHSQFVPSEAYARLSGNPLTGRLTLNGFFWSSSEGTLGGNMGNLEARGNVVSKRQLPADLAPKQMETEISRGYYSDDGLRSQKSDHIATTEIRGSSSSSELEFF